MCGLNALIHAKSLAQRLAHAEYSGRFPCSGTAPSGGPFTARSPLASELVHLCCGPEHILVIFLVLVEGSALSPAGDTPGLPGSRAELLGVAAGSLRGPR